MTDETYPGGLNTLISRWERRRVRLKFDDASALPPLDVDFTPIKTQLIPNPPEPPAEPSTMAARKRYEQAQELAGKSELTLLNAELIAHSRKRRYPPHAPALFRRLWAEEGPFLMQELDTRWLISSVITFADFGETEPDRRIGQSLNILFSYMKLAEFERQYSGTSSTDPFPPGKRIKEDLPMGMPPFALMRGDLEANFLAPLWLDAEAAPGAGPLALHLLDQLNRDSGSLFRRLKLMRDAREAQKAARQRNSE
ncbi:hypothetical protein [Pseudoprimorskyibacter insulae]|uniref:Uncharacterized protein n=1 Tax=Pseudoprimorskyibacter insulae TaxID=1695997 RepID=A0A2R8AX58_9RHOB|nr:hypothetical protein [Pseudoprimorskyibacter insulae]SPF80527.1 hypothetical protein PRI8871_02337 [Pseudoprimorskyibacter insulae]